MKKISLRIKIFVSFGLIIFAVMSVLTFVHVQELKKDYLEALEWRSEALAQLIFRDIKLIKKYTPTALQNPQRLYPKLSSSCEQLYELNKNSNIAHCAVVDPRGYIVAHNQPSLIGQQVSPNIGGNLQDSDTVTALAGNQYHTLIPIVEQVDQKERFLGMIDIGIPKNVVALKIKRLINDSIGLLALFLFVTFFSTSLLLYVLVGKPLSKLMHVANEIIKGNYGERAQLTTRDEIGQTGKAFDTMTSTLINIIQERDNHIENINKLSSELKEHRDHLEEQVQIRTDELTIAKEAAETANHYKSDFLARMSHEIRTPLNAVTGLTNIVLKSEMTNEQRDYLNKVKIASNNLLEVINDILDFSKVEAGRLELTDTPFNLDQMLEQLADLFSNRVASKDIELIFRVDPHVPRSLQGDPGRLKQILTNLIENGVKFTETGEISVGVSLSNENAPSNEHVILMFRVKDTGIGIAADVLPTLFDAFTQADTSLTRQHEGTGLGLAICRRLVELMDGVIEAESIPGQGSTFSFTAKLKTRREEKSPTTVPAMLRGLKTLVVDDSEASRLTLVDLLESLAFNATAVKSGEKAIEMLHQANRKEPYQLLLIDWKMPGMDGIETARQIREIELREKDSHGISDSNHQPMPIIILVTAYGLELAQQSKYKESVDALLLKPVKPSQLFNTIMEQLGHGELSITLHDHESTFQPSKSLSGRRVLVVEDSDLNRYVAVTLLEDMELTVEVAENGQTAVDKVTQSPNNQYDIVFMDIQMPLVDGYEATRRIRQWEITTQNRSSGQSANPSANPGGRLPIIALTAHALKGEKEKCLAADMDDYLPKPLDEQDLHRVLLKWIAS